MQIWPGRPYPLGATYDGAGTNFALFSEVADEGRAVPDRRRRHGDPGRADRDRRASSGTPTCPACSPGSATATGCTGPTSPSRAPLQPGQAAARPVRQGRRRADATATSRCSPTLRRARRRRNDQDSLGHTMLSVVINPYFDWGNDRPPAHEYHETVIYEAHVKGLTEPTPTCPRRCAARTPGIAHPAIDRAPDALGVTAIELMPVHQFVQDTTWSTRAWRNYWGYNTIGFFAPHNAYAASGQRGQQVLEFKAMVKALHEADIEVILDVVYNHTAEGNHLGPTLAFRGHRQRRLLPAGRRRPARTTTTPPAPGNTLLMRHPHVLQLIMDSLRYWVTEMHVDGFRFDLAATLARQFHEVDRLSAFFDLVQQDPVVSQVKLIAEPWDVGEGGYQVGNFPPLWTEWNGKYRDTVRDFWRGEPAHARRVRLPADRLLRPLRALRPQADRLDQLRHRPRRLHAARPGLLQREAQRGQRRGQQRRREPQPLLELRRRGADRRPGDPRAAGPPAAQLPRHAAALAGRADDRARRRARPHPAGQQQRLLPGQRALLGGLGPRGRQQELLAFTRRVVALRKDHPVFRRRRFFAGEVTQAGRRRRATSPGSPPTGRRWRTATGATTTPAR